MIVGLEIGFAPEGMPYDIVLFLHILTAIIGFGSTFVWPVLSVEARKLPPEQALVVNRIAMGASKKLTTPFTIATGILGAALIGMSDGFYEFSQSWVSLAFLLWLAGAGLALGLHGPNLGAMLALQEEMVAAGPPQGGPPPQVAELQERGKKAQMYGGILHLLFAVLLIVMVFMPEAAS